MHHLYYLHAALTACCLAADPTVQELTDGVHRRIQDFRNIEATFDVDAQFWRSPDADNGVSQTALPSDAPRKIRTRDVFRIMDPNRPDRDRPWRSWTQSIQEDGRWVVNKFLTFDGEQSVHFVRRPITGLKDFHRGAIVPMESTADYDENIYDRFLCTDHNGLAEYLDPGWKISRSLDNHWHVDGTVDWQSRTACVLRGANDAVDHLVHVIGHPHFLIVRRTVTARDQSKPLMDWEVISAGEFDGILYPQRGRLTQAAAPGQARIEYEFRVSSVTTLPETARTQWQPEWPTGTAVRDQITDQNVTIPHAAGELEQINNRRALDTAEAPTPVRKGLLILVVNLVLFAGLAVCWFRGRRRTP